MALVGRVCARAGSRVGAIRAGWGAGSDCRGRRREWRRITNGTGLGERTGCVLRAVDTTTTSARETIRGENETKIQNILLPDVTKESVMACSGRPSTSDDGTIVSTGRRRGSPGGNGNKKRRSILKEKKNYQFAAIASTGMVSGLAFVCTYFRFTRHLEPGADLPWSEMGGTLLLIVGAAVGMELWAQWAHDALWHNSLWSLHKSHHEPREGPFEANDIFAIINAVPAISLISYGFFHDGMVPGLCYGAGLGITVFGMAYMFIHDGLVHKRFPVGPIGEVPYLKKVAAAHSIHHTEEFGGIPYGLFLGPIELASRPGGTDALNKLMEARDPSRRGKSASSSSSSSSPE